MKRWFMLTLVGVDQKGIVAGLTRALCEGGANLGETSMVRLGGNFTIMMMVESEEDENTLRNRISEVAGKFNLSCHIDPIEGKLHQHLEPNVRITLHGADRSGIVADVTSALAELGFNITHLESDVGGTQDASIYLLHIGGVSPIDVEELKPIVEKLATTWKVTVRVEAIDTMIG